MCLFDGHKFALPSDEELNAQPSQIIKLKTTTRPITIATFVPSGIYLLEIFCSFLLRATLDLK